MIPFSIVSPSQLEFGPGKLTLVPSIVKTLSPSGLVLVLSDKGVSQTGAPAKVVEALRNEGYTVSLVDSVPPEPSTHDLDAVAAGLKGNAAAIVAIGGGSVMDAAKILAVLTGKGWGTVELAERGVPGRGIPTVMIPTTAGTGSESTPNAIVLFPEKNLKVGIVSPYFMPDRVVLDPELTLGLPPKLTASTGVDAFCHLLECFISKKANPMSDMMAREGMRLLLPALPLVYNNGTDLEARSATLLAAYYGGACIAASGTTAVHALSYPLGGTYRVPHGVSNAALLVPVMSYQKKKIAPRLAEAARAIGLVPAGSGSSAEEEADLLIKSLDNLVKELKIPASLKDLGVPDGALASLTEAAYGVRRLLDNNPVELSRKDIRVIYESVK